MDQSSTMEPEMPTVPLRRGPKAMPPVEVQAEQAGPPEPPVSVAPTHCPRCETKLISPESLGWCPKCGYCRSIEEGAANVPVAEGEASKKGSVLGAAEFLELVRRIPRWARILMGGAVGVILLSVAGDLLLPEDSLVRALWSTLQLLLGLGIVIGAQISLLLLLAPSDGNLSAKDVLFPKRLWGLTIHRLPATRKQVWLGAWGALGAACALFLVGGLSYWFQYYNPKRVANQELTRAVKDLAEGRKDESLEESVKDVANTQDLTNGKKDLPKPKSVPDKTPTYQTAIIGYNVTEDDNRISSLLLATLVEGELKFVGETKQGIDSRASKELLDLLPALVTERPQIKGAKGVAIWVQPKLLCEVYSTGFDTNGRLINPTFKALLKNE